MKNGLWSKLLLIVAVVICSTSSFAQSPAIEWQNSFGGSSKDYGYHIQQTKDSGFIAICTTYSSDSEVTGFHGNQDVWAIKISRTGILQWQRCLGGSLVDQGRGVQQTFDGGYVLACSSNSADGDVTSSFGGYNVWVIKLDAIGNIVWQRTYGGTGSEEASSIQQTSDSGFIVAGITNSSDGQLAGLHIGNFDSWVFKLNDTGALVWSKTYGGTDYDAPSSIQQTNEGGYILGGITKSTDVDVTSHYGGYDYWAVKLDDTGKILWQKSYGGPGDDMCESIRQTFDGGYIINGYSNSNTGMVEDNHGGADVWALKLDDTGGILWAKTFGGTGEELAYSVQQTKDSGYVIAANTMSSDGDISGFIGVQDMWLVMADKNGNLIWEKCLGGDSLDYLEDCIQTNDNGFALVGFTRSISPYVTHSFGSADVWVVKLFPGTVSASMLSAEANLRIYPNPSEDKITIIQKHKMSIISIVNVEGREVYRMSDCNARAVTLDISTFPSGIYYLKADTLPAKCFLKSK